MGFNLPDDWGDYWRTCDQCGARYHASGTDECNCVPCEDCGDLVPPEDAEEQGDLCAKHWGAKQDAEEQAEMDEIEKRDERIANLQAMLARAHRDRRKLDRWWADHLKREREAAMLRELRSKVPQYLALTDHREARAGFSAMLDALDERDKPSDSMTLAELLEHTEDKAGK